MEIARIHTPIETSGVGATRLAVDGCLRRVCNCWDPYIISAWPGAMGGCHLCPFWVATQGLFTALHRSCIKARPMGLYL